MNYQRTYGQSVGVLTTYDHLMTYIKNNISQLTNRTELLTVCNHKDQEWLESNNLNHDNLIKIEFVTNYYPHSKNTAIGCLALIGGTDPLLCFIEFNHPIRHHVIELIQITKLQIIGSVDGFLGGLEYDIDYTA
jgi:hypothetical protein